MAKLPGKIKQEAQRRFQVIATNIRRGSFTEQEDLLLKRGVEKYGATGKWYEIAQFINDSICPKRHTIRTGKQTYNRWQKIKHSTGLNSQFKTTASNEDRMDLDPFQITMQSILQKKGSTSEEWLTAEKQESKVVEEDKEIVEEEVVEEDEEELVIQI